MSQRRVRGAQESLGQVVLVFESIIVFLAGLAVFGLKALPAGVEPWWGVVGGSVVAVLMLAASGALRWRGGIVLGWVLQVVLLAGSVLVPAILIVALIFGGMWAYATIKGASLDRRNARLAAEPADSNGD
ncbi:DUF4233 domain-containing protein [Microbacterium sp. SORGH_AS_0888]|uniref:DUF4233 domain-containing protein n=1 Tax=Microbacterium sp. SORGH_AS_0888 TaxID=3041791 RepID=UPI002783D09F|nr:DUF4233 domain-containing protein [Microbacterium sp. SORGH_AS_0888]MDQ1128695.1 hypothetical protein [Microbacterium sp. SORGH_AS_0888]